jgi:3-methyladenine DNA glycosylase/8-oxoguanine DNA glycosylase
VRHNPPAAVRKGRLLGLFPEGLTPGRLLNTLEAELRGAGLSRNTLLALQDLARRTLEGDVPDFKVLESMPDEEVITRLTTIRGIGRRSVEMLLLFSLGRPDVLPVDDLGIRKGFQVVYGMKRMPAAVTLLHAGRVWIPYRSAASWYLWRAMRLRM